MIPAYEDGWKPYQTTREEYIYNTTRANTKQGVIDCVREYMQRNDCSPEVVGLMESVLANDELLGKTHVVRDGSYRQCVILVRPDGLMAHQGTTDLQFYVDNAETFFLNITDQTWAEVEAELDDGFDYYYPYEMVADDV